MYTKYSQQCSVCGANAEFLFVMTSRPGAQPLLLNSMLCRMFTSDTLHNQPHLVAEQRIVICDNAPLTGRQLMNIKVIH